MCDGEERERELVMMKGVWRRRWWTVGDGGVGGGAGDEEGGDRGNGEEMKRF